MDNLFRGRMTRFLSEYIRFEDFHFDSNGMVHDISMRSGIGKLVDEGAFTPEELQNEAKKYDIVLPITYIEECVKETKNRRR